MRPLPSQSCCFFSFKVLLGDIIYCYPAALRIAAHSDTKLQGTFLWEPLRWNRYLGCLVESRTITLVKFDSTEKNLRINDIGTEQLEVMY
jgi:hypothetical protein